MHASNKFTHILTALISNKRIAKSTKPIHHWTLQLIRITPLYSVGRVNETKVTGACLQCSRNKVFYIDFLDGTDFVSGDANRYRDKTTPCLIWQVMVSAISQIPSS